MSTPNLKFEVKEEPDLNVDENQPITFTILNIKQETVGEFDSNIKQVKNEQSDKEESDVSEADYESSEFEEGSDNAKKICANCNQLKKIRSNPMCGSCYQNYLKKKRQDPKWKQKYYRTCADCKKFKEHHGRGLCRRCYFKIRYNSKEDLKKYATISEIKKAKKAKRLEEKRRKAEEKAKKLEKKQKRLEEKTRKAEEKFISNQLDEIYMLPCSSTFVATSTNEVPQTICNKCHEPKKFYCQSVCKECYMRDLEDQEKEQKDFIICANCNEDKQNHLFGLCRDCFDIIQQGTSKEAERDRPVVKQEVDDTLSDPKVDVKPEIVSD